MNILSTILDILKTIFSGISTICTLKKERKKKADIVISNNQETRISKNTAKNVSVKIENNKKTEVNNNSWD